MILVSWLPRPVCRTAPERGLERGLLRTFAGSPRRRFGALRKFAGSSQPGRGGFAKVRGIFSPIGSPSGSKTFTRRGTCLASLGFGESARWALAKEFREVPLSGNAGPKRGRACWNESRGRRRCSFPLHIHHGFRLWREPPFPRRFRGRSRSFGPRPSTCGATLYS
jgi:hypothetical protein